MKDHHETLNRTIDAIYTGISQGKVHSGLRKKKYKNKEVKIVILKYKTEEETLVELIKRAKAGLPNNKTSLFKGDHADSGLYTAFNRYKIKMVYIPEIIFKKMITQCGNS